LILRLGRMLHLSGAPAPRLEEALTETARRLGLAGQFFSTPTSVFVSLGEGEAERTHLVRVEPSDVNLEKMAKVDGVLVGMLRGDYSPEEAARRMDAIEAAPSRYGWGALLAAGAAASAASACFFGGGLPEAAASAALGFLVALLAGVADRVPSLGRVATFLSGILVAFLAGVLTRAAGPVSLPVVTLSALIALVPGLTLTVAMAEIASRHLVAGTARLTGAVFVFLSMGFGVAVGERLAGFLLPAAPESVSRALPAWATAAALLVASAAFTVLFRAHPRAVLWILPAGVLTFLGARAGALLFSPELGAFLGAIVAGMAGNLYARLLHRPAAVPLVPAIMFLVPGSLGLESVSSLVARDVVTGIETAFLVILVSVALVMGLLVANALLPPRHAL
jgi:uncharacterized membrane protein YjjP (DUF1212 family)